MAKDFFLSDFQKADAKPSAKPMYASGSRIR
jgi:hypothetical protein